MKDKFLKPDIIWKSVIGTGYLILVIEVCVRVIFTQGMPILWCIPIYMGASYMAEITYEWVSQIFKLA